jgi:transcriptional regulator with XRE-family HTH domain
MTPATFKAQRKALGLSARQMALALGWGEASERSVRRLEAGDYPVTGPVARAVALLRRLHEEGNRGGGLVKAAQCEAYADHNTTATEET